MGSSGSGAVNQVQILPGALPGAGGLSDGDWVVIVRRLRLSLREGEVIRCLVCEQKDRVIAVQLGISTHTVRSHLERIFRKLGVHTRVGVVVAVFSEALKIVREGATTSQLQETTSMLGGEE